MIASVNSAFTEYAASLSAQNHDNLQEKKKSLQSMYDVIQEEELNENINKVEQADANSKHVMSWRLINEITGRKDAKKGIIKVKVNLKDSPNGMIISKAYLVMNQLLPIWRKTSKLPLNHWTFQMGLLRWKNTSKSKERLVTEKQQALMVYPQKCSNLQTLMTSF